MSSDELDLDMEAIGEGTAGSPADDKAARPDLNLSVQVEKTGACARHVIVSIPREDIERCFTEKFDELAPKAEVPGFRPGRAPRSLIENRFRKLIADQVKASLLMDSLAQLNRRNDFSAIGEPDFDYEAIRLPDDGPMTFEFNIEVRPEFQLPAWKGLKLQRPQHQFSDEEVMEEVHRTLRRIADLVPVDEPARLGDKLVVHLRSRHEGKLVSATEEEKVIDLRKTLSLGDALLEGFDDLVVGVRGGETRTARINVFEDADSPLAGAELELEIEVLDVKRPDLSDPDRLAASFGFPSQAEAAQKARRQLEGALAYEQRQRIREQISQLLTEAADWDLPEDLLRRQSRRELDRAHIEMRASGFSDEQIRAQENRLRHRALERTRTILKEHFILERIAEEEGVEDAPEDYNREIEMIAAQSNDSPRRVRARLERNGQMDMLRNMIVEQKVIDLIMAHAEFVPQPYQRRTTDEVSAVHFFAGGAEAPDIPAAKYADDQPAPLPAAVDRR